jgi:hypothetical protein
LHVTRKKHEKPEWQVESAPAEFVSQAVRRDLPRPCPVASSPLYEDFEDEPDRLVVEEMMRLALRDAKSNPGRRKTPVCLIVPHHPALEDYLSAGDDPPEADIAAAEALIRDEVGQPEIDMEEFAKLWEAAHADISDDRLEDRIAQRQRRVDALQARYEARTRAAEANCEMLIEKGNTIGLQICDLKRDLDLYRRIEAGERETLAARIDAMRMRIGDAEKEQRELDQQYSVLVEEEKERTRVERAKSRKSNQADPINTG